MYHNVHIWLPNNEVVRISLFYIQFLNNSFEKIEFLYDCVIFIKCCESSNICSVLISAFLGKGQNLGVYRIVFEDLPASIDNLMVANWINWQHVSGAKSKQIFANIKSKLMQIFKYNTVNSILMQSLCSFGYLTSV